MCNALLSEEIGNVAMASDLEAIMGRFADDCEF